jgi:hypothetical protein
MPDGLNTFTLGNLLKGPCNVLYADPAVVDAPANIADIFDPDGGGYELAEGWKQFGATTAGTAYGRQFSTTGYVIEQATGNVDEEVTEVVRTVQATFGEVTPELLQMLEQATNLTTVAKAKGRSAEKQVRTGTVESLKNYLIAFVGRRLTGQGADVTESGGKVRGAFVVGGLNKAKITGDQVALQLARGQLASAALTLQAYIDDSQPEGEEHGFWFAEQPGTIEAV